MVLNAPISASIGGAGLPVGLPHLLQCHCACHIIMCKCYMYNTIIYTNNIYIYNHIYIYYLYIYILFVYNIYIYMYIINPHNSMKLQLWDRIQLFRSSSNCRLSLEPGSLQWGHGTPVAPRLERLECQPIMSQTSISQHIYVSIR